MKLSFSRSFKYKINLTLMSLMVMGIVILLGYLASRHRLRFDATKIKEFSLSPQTRKILQALDREVKITCFLKRGGGKKRG